MKKKFLLLFLSMITLSASAQEVDNGTKGTIRVQKKGTLHSVLYDDVNFRLVCRDVYGNILDSAVVFFDLDFAVRGIAYKEETNGCFISKENQVRLSRLDDLVELRFSNIKAKDRYGSIVTFPPLRVQTGKSRERTDY